MCPAGRSMTTCAYDCDLCGKRHVMEPLVQLALCPVADPICKMLLHAWPHPFAAIAQQW